MLVNLSGGAGYAQRGITTLPSITSIANIPKAPVIPSTTGWQISTEKMVLPDWYGKLPPAPAGSSYGWGTQDKPPALIPDPLGTYGGTPTTKLNPITNKEELINPTLTQRPWFYPAIGVAGLVILFIFMNKHKSQPQALVA